MLGFKNGLLSIISIYVRFPDDLTTFLQLFLEVAPSGYNADVKEEK